MARADRPKVVVLGAGFGGLWVARTLRDAACDVLLVDRNNYHTFPALLYQVAAAELQAEDIAYPVRSILWRMPAIHFARAEARSVDLRRSVVETDGRPIPFDFLVLATGSVADSFGVPGVSEHALYLKSLEQGVTLRNRVVGSFERAVHEGDAAERDRLLTFIIAGGGPTGVEYAGALSELVRGPLRRDYPRLDFQRVRFVLVEAGPTLLPGFPKRVQAYALGRLAKMGVEVRLSAPVERVDATGVHLATGEFLASATAVWAAGVRGEPLAAESGLPVARDGRVNVLPTLQIPGWPRVYAIGDVARIDEGDRILPMVAQVAIQSGVCAAQNIRRQLAGGDVAPFRYDDKGVMVAIGRNAAGAVIRGRALTGFLAWVVWLGLHLYKLIGFRNRLLVLINWAWDYSLYGRAARFIFPAEGASSWHAARPASGQGERAGGDEPDAAV